MGWSWRHRAVRAAFRVVQCPALPVAALGALALSACTSTDLAKMSAAQPRGATVAFESIDGPPAAQFQKLVQDLNDEAQARKLAVISRESPSAYRVRGYLAAEVAKDKTTVSWVWDVFDGEQHRSLRISGAETVNAHPRDAWQVADDALLKRIASDSMEQLAAFLTSPDAAPGAAQPAEVALIGQDAGTPEASGIFRIFQPQADPLPENAAPTPAVDNGVPMPRRRPEPVAALTPQQTAMLAAAQRVAP